MATDASTLLSQVASRGIYGIEPTTLQAAQDYAKCAGVSGGTAATLMTGVAANKLYALSGNDLRSVLVFLLSQGQSATTAQQLLAIAAANGFYGLAPLDLKRCILAMLRYSTICSGAPLAPTNLTVLGTTSSSITIQWSQPLSIPVIPISSYIVKYGTTSGVYTTTITGLPSGVFSYTITGLSASTSYFIVVEAVNGICPSANSSELSTSTPAATNGLLNGLISYWKFDDDEAALGNATDSVGSNPLALSANATCGTTFCPNGVINGACCLGVGSTSASHADNTDFSPGAGISFSISIWMQSTDWTTAAANNFLVLKGDDATLNSYEIFSNGVGGPIRGLVQDTNSTLVQGNFTTTPTANTWHHFVLVFDSAGLQGRGYYDGTLAFSGALTSANMKVGAQIFTLGVRAGHTAIANLKMDEFGMWHKALNATDVTNLFNGGAALPLSSFTT